MAFGDDEEEYEYSVEEQQQKMYDLIGFGENHGFPAEDQYLHDLFYTYYYVDDISVRDRIEIYDRMVERLADVYGIDFNVFEWEDFRAWYEGAFA